MDENLDALAIGSNSTRVKREEELQPRGRLEAQGAAWRQQTHEHERQPTVDGLPLGSSYSFRLRTRRTRILAELSFQGLRTKDLATFEQICAKLNAKCFT